MASFGSTRRRAWIVALAVLMVGGALAAYFLWLRPRVLPEPGSKRYEEYEDTFYRGLAALDADVPQVAEPSLTRAIELISEHVRTRFRMTDSPLG